MDAPLPSALRSAAVFPSGESPQALRGFQIVRRLGSGGAGQVYLGRSKGGRLVAIKVLSDTKERDPAFSHALVREASLCVRLTHPAIVQVRALIEDEGFAALVFDYVEGLALSRLMKFCAAHGVRLPDRVTWHIVERVLSALAFAHAQTDESHESAPIVHRDVSPSNVLLAWSGDVKLTDFGIAKMLGVSPATQFGLVKGTLGCMSPEQARGEPVDQRADVYAAGLLAWRLATGRNPFASQEKEEIELLRAMRNPRIKPLSALRPNLPEPVLQCVANSLAADPQYRTVSADEFARMVRASFDVEAGHAELADLLGRWRSALERTQGRADGTASTDSSGPRYDTMRYEDAHVDEEVPVDGPTLQVQALPGDRAIWEALSQGVHLPRVSVSDSDRVRPSDAALTAARAAPPPAPVPVVAPPAAPPPPPPDIPPPPFFEDKTIVAPPPAMALDAPTLPQVPVTPLALQPPVLAAAAPLGVASSFPPPVMVSPSQSPPAFADGVDHPAIAPDTDDELALLKARRRARNRTVLVLLGALVLVLVGIWLASLQKPPS